MKKQFFVVALVCSMSLLQASSPINSSNSAFRPHSLSSNSSQMNKFLNEQLTPSQELSSNTANNIDHTLQTPHKNTRATTPLLLFLPIDDAQSKSTSCSNSPERKADDCIPNNPAQQSNSHQLPRSLSIPTHSPTFNSNPVENNETPIRLSDLAIWSLNKQHYLLGLISASSAIGTAVAVRNEQPAAAVGLGLLTTLTGCGAWATHKFRKNWYSENIIDGVPMNIYHCQIPEKLAQAQHAANKRVYDKAMAIPADIYHKSTAGMKHIWFTPKK